MPVNISFPGKDASNPFNEQLEFFRRKLNLPTERWDDIQKSANDRAFIVAGAGQADLLNDLNGAIRKSIEDGRGLEAFRKEFSTIVKKHGWTGWTGEGSAAGEAWRTRVIYQTNMSTSYAAGRWQQLKHPDLLKLRPYWRYIHADGVMYPRPLHVSWHGMVLPHDHPFWDTHFPPNGWLCHCRVTSADLAEYTAAQEDGRGEPPAGWQATDPKTGAPVGIDKGFDYAPGANAARPLKELIDQKLVKLDAPIGAAMHEALKPALQAEQQAAWQGMIDRASSTMKASGEAQLAHVIMPTTVRSLAEHGVVLDNAAVWLRDDELVHALRAYKANHGGTLPLAIWSDLRHLLMTATPYLDTVDRALIYAFDVKGGLGKILVRINYREKARFDGVRDRITSNFIRTGGVVDVDNVVLDARYLKLKK